MLRHLVPALVVAGLAACPDHPGPTGSTPAEFAPTPTPIGAAIGAPVEATIDAAGGSLTSADGVLRLVVPPSAVSAPTDFAIQVITNECYAHIGDGYRLTSTADAFAVPVELHFAYTDEDLESTEAAALGVAYQDADGFWRWQDAATLDEGQHEIVLPTQHFTDFSRTAGWKLVATRDSLPFGESTDVRLLRCVFLHDSGDEDQVSLLYDCDNGANQPPDSAFAVNNPVKPSTWAVNGAPGGTTGDGRVSLGSKDQTIYNAPDAEPTANPVAVSVETTTGLLVTHIYVGEPIWTGTSEVLVVYDSIGDFTRTVDTQATVTWRWDPLYNAYTPTGTVTYDVVGTYAQGYPPEICHVTAHYTGPATEGQLALLDLGDGTLTYFGGGYATNANVTESDSCEGDTTLPTILTWWPGFRPPASDPLAMGTVQVDDDGHPFIEQNVSFSSSGATQTNSYLFEQQ